MPDKRTRLLEAATELRLPPAPRRRGILSVSDCLVSLRLQMWMPSMFGPMPDVPPALARDPMDRRPVSPEVRSQHRRARMLERMTKVFAERGYEAATVDRLIVGGRTSMGTFYKEFDGKEDCFAAVCDWVIAEVRARIVEAIPAAAHWPTRTAAGVRVVVEFAGEKPLAARVVLLEAQTGGEAAASRHAATLAEVAAFLHRGRAQSASPKDLPERFEQTAVSGLAWLLQSRLARGGIEDPAELWRPMARIRSSPT